MPQLRIGTWNVEWMNDLFEGDPPAFKPDTDLVRGPRRENTVAQRRADIAGVLDELELDAFVVVEGPNRAEELQLFFDTDVEGTWACVVQPSGAQSVGLAVRTDRGLFADPPFTWFDARSSSEAPLLKAATDPFEMDTDDDNVREVHTFPRRPLYAELHVAGGGAVRVLGVHLKSKGVFGSFEWVQWWARAAGARKKLLAECYQLRTAFLDAYLADEATRTTPLLVCGDINDGPGFDALEMRLQASGVERLMGSVWDPDRGLGNVIYDTLSPEKQQKLDFRKLYTASFKDPIFDGIYQRVWIDHILYTRNGGDWVSEGRIHEEMNNAQKIYFKYPHASDHFPVTCLVDVG